MRIRRWNQTCLLKFPTQRSRIARVALVFVSTEISMTEETLKKQQAMSALLKSGELGYHCLGKCYS